MYEALRLRPEFFETVIGDQFLHKLVTIVVSADVDKQRKLLSHKQEYAEVLEFIQSEAIPFEEKYKEILSLGGIEDSLEEQTEKKKGFSFFIKSLLHHR